MPIYNTFKDISLILFLFFTQYKEIIPITHLCYAAKQLYNLTQQSKYNIFRVLRHLLKVANKIFNSRSQGKKLKVTSWSDHDVAQLDPKKNITTMSELFHRDFARTKFKFQFIPDAHPTACPTEWQGWKYHLPLSYFLSYFSTAIQLRFNLCRWERPDVRIICSFIWTFFMFCNTKEVRLSGKNGKSSLIMTYTLLWCMSFNSLVQFIPVSVSL